MPKQSLCLLAHVHGVTQSVHIVVSGVESHFLLNGVASEGISVFVPLYMVTSCAMGSVVTQPQCRDIHRLTPFM